MELVGMMVEWSRASTTERALIRRRFFVIFYSLRGLEDGPATHTI